MTVRVDEFEIWTMRLSRQGYGDIATIKNLDIGSFIRLIHYEKYLDKYDQVFRELNKK